MKKILSLILVLSLLILGIFTATGALAKQEIQVEPEVQPQAYEWVDVNSAMYVSVASNPTVYPKELAKLYPVTKWVEWGTTAQVDYKVNGIIEGEIYTALYDSIDLIIYLCCRAPLYPLGYRVFVFQLFRVDRRVTGNNLIHI